MGKRDRNKVTDTGEARELPRLQSRGHCQAQSQAQPSNGTIAASTGTVGCARVGEGHCHSDIVIG